MKTKDLLNIVAIINVILLIMTSSGIIHGAFFSIGGSYAAFHINYQFKTKDGIFSFLKDGK